MKKILLSILVSVIWLVWFWYCFNVTDWWWKYIQVWTYASYLTFSPADKSLSYTTCIWIFDNCDINFIHNWITESNLWKWLNCFTWIYYAASTSNNPQLSNNWSSCAVAVNIFPDTYWWFCNSCPTCPTCQEQLTSTWCQQEYSLMPISSCDSEYCQLNWLCWTWSSWSWDLQWSSLFINWIQHVWWSIIDVTIPSEIQRNYLYTWENEETFKLDVEGLNGDPDYIQWIIDVNSYRPTSEDFTNTFIWGLTLIFPYIIITAFIVFIWRFIRKIFK